MPTRRRIFLVVIASLFLIGSLFLNWRSQRRSDSLLFWTGDPLSNPPRYEIEFRCHIGNLRIGYQRWDALKPEAATDTGVIVCYDSPRNTIWQSREIEEDELHFSRILARKWREPLFYRHPTNAGVRIPFWFVSLLASLFLVKTGFHVIRVARRIQRNQCVTCGYDLRASKDRCPECGTTIEGPIESSTTPT